MKQKQYKFTLTKNYISNWTVKEAIREILQNAYDSSGQEHIDIADDSISIRNDNVKLHINTLLMGVGTKSNDGSKVGGFNEGSILSILVLTREGYNVMVTNDNETWTPSFIYDEDLEQEVLAIDVIPCSCGYGYFEYFIGGLNPLTIQEIKDEFLGLDGEYESKSTQYGEILLGSKYKGKMFVEGLPIMNDNRFAYGYNFNANVVKLDRDRKSINLYELYEICSKSLMSLDKENMSFVDELIEGTDSDAYYIKDRFVSLTNGFVDNYCGYLNEKYNIKENSVIINATSKEVIQELERKQKQGENIDIIVTDKKVQADVINMRNSFSSNVINDTFNEVQTRSKEDDAYSDFEDSGFELLLSWVQRYKNLLDDNAKDELINDVLPCLETNNFHLIQDDVYEKYNI